MISLVLGMSVRASQISVVSSVLYWYTSIKEILRGGITIDTINEYLSYGASAVAFGASIFRKEWLQAGKFPLIKKDIQALLNKLKQTPA